MIGLVTDSNAMLPEELRRRLGVEVVPLALVIDDVPVFEDEQLEVQDTLRRLRRGAKVTSAAPPPGLFEDLYARLVSHGATEIVSVHVGSAYSGTLGSASVAARGCTVPVHLVDSGTASFGIGFCVWRAAELLGSGAQPAEAAAAVAGYGKQCSSVFTVAEVGRAHAGGRITVGAGGEGTPVLAMAAAGVKELGRALDIEEAVELMAAEVARSGSPIRVAVGHADNADGAEVLTARLSGLSQIAEIVRYVSGVSVAAHVGVGTFGAVVAPG